jgi:hypothetical protein
MERSLVAALFLAAAAPALAAPHVNLAPPPVSAAQAVSSAEKYVAALDLGGQSYYAAEVKFDRMARNAQGKADFFWSVLFMPSGAARSGDARITVVVSMDRKVSHTSSPIINK